MKRVIVYHDTETLASRNRRPRMGEVVAYRAIANFDEIENKKFDEVIDLSTPKEPKKSKIVASEKPDA